MVVGAKTAYKVRVNIVEGRDLKGRDSNGTSDPVCVVQVADQKRRTDIIKNVNNAVWDQSFFFDLELTEPEFKQANIVISVYDSNTVYRNVLIGSFELAFTQVYKQKGHEYFSTWVALVDPTDTFEGVQGYIRMSVSVLAPGDEMVTHDDQLDDSKFSLDLSSLVLTPPRIKTRENYLYLRIYRAENLPKMDRFGSADGYVQVKFAGNPPIKTDVFKDSYNPTWTTLLAIPVTTPTMADTIEISIFDWDRGTTDELIATEFFPFEKVQKAKKLTPFWLNFYGGFEGQKNASRHKLMNQGLVDEIAWRGRMLLEVEFTPFDQDTKLYKQEIAPLAREPPNVEYCLRFDLMEGAELPTSGKVVVELRIGDKKWESGKASVSKGTASWYWQMPEQTLLFPDDLDQVPDIFLYLMEVGVTGRTRLTYKRIPAREVFGFAKEPDWKMLKDDPTTDDVKDDEIPGFLLYRLSFAKATEARKPKNVRPEVVKPELHKHVLRCHLYMARNLAAADDNGLVDAFCVARMGKASGKTKRIDKSNFPEWYETIDMEVEVPKDLRYAPDINVFVWDHDRIGRNDFLGRFHCPAADVGPQRGKPKWFTLTAEDAPGAPLGQVLASFQLLPAGSPINKVDLRPKTVPSTVEIQAVGLRNIDTRTWRDPNTSIEFSLGNQKNVVRTKKSNSPSGINPNHLENLELHAELPVDPLYAPHLEVRVFNHTGKDKLIGSGAIPLASFLPWGKMRMLRNKMPPKPTGQEIATRPPKPEQPPAAAADGDDDAAAGRKSSKSSKGSKGKAPDLETGDGPSASGDAATPLLDKQDDESKESPMKKVVAGCTAGFTKVTDKTRSFFDEHKYDDVSKFINDGERTIGETKEVTLEDDRGVNLTAAETESEVDRRKKYSTELEFHLKDMAFDEYNLYTGKLRGLTWFQRRFRKESAKQRCIGQFKGRIRIVEVGTHADPLPLLAEVYQPKKLVMRAYILRAVQLVPLKNERDLDTYVVIKNGRGRKHRVSGRKDMQSNTLYPNFYKPYELAVELPGRGDLEIELWDADVFGDNLLGTTVIDMENRWFSKHWHKMTTKPIEYRTLWNPTSRSPQGKLEMWFELMTEAKAKETPLTRIAPDEPMPFQLRCAIFQAQNVPFRDKTMSDVFVRAAPEGMKYQQTDIHWRSTDGDAAWNWRIVHDVMLPLAVSRYRIQIWDKDLLSANDVIAEATINLRGFMQRAYRRGDMIEMPKQWIELTHPNYDGPQGTIQVQFNLLPEPVAKVRPAGKGRSDPNQYPTLEPPDRPPSSYNPLNPFTSLKYIIWTKNRYKIMAVCFILLFVVILVPIIKIFK